MLKYIFQIVWAMTFCGTVLAQPGVLPRFPALNPDGSRLAFSWQGDIWIYNMESEQSQRLTVHEAYEAHPAWHPSEERLLFTSNRFGSTNIMEMDLTSGHLVQKTYYSSGDSDPSYDREGNIYFNGSRAYKQVEREPEILILESDYKTPYRFLDALGSEPVLSPDGRYVALVKGNCRLSREQYRGPANRDIWIYDTEEEKYLQVTTDEGQDAHPRWAQDGQLFFMSARTGKYNVYATRIQEDGTFEDFREITKFTEDGIRNFTVSLNGKEIVVEHQDGFKRINPMNGQAREMKFVLPGDSHFYPEEYVSLDNKITEFSMSPDEEYIAVQAHDEIFVIKNDKDNPRSQRITRHSWKDDNPVWNTDSTLLFISDRSGSEEVYEVRPATKEYPTLYNSYAYEIRTVLEEGKERKLEMVMSPDHSRLAIVKDYGKLVVYDIDTTGRLNNPVTLLDGWAEPGDISWSPDNRWLAFSQPDLDFNREVYITAADGSMDPVNVSMHPRSDRSPVWSRDGSKLAFISNRNNGDDDVWFVWLKKADWEKSKQDWKEEKFSGKSSKKDTKKDSVVKVEIDFENIYRRSVQVTSMPGDESGLFIGPKGETFYFNAKQGVKTVLYSVKWDGSELEPVVNHSLRRSLLSKDGKKVYYLSGGKLQTLNLSNKKTESIPFSARIKVDHQAEREQIFEELWRVLNDRFYDPGFHGRDWQVLKEKYKPWAMKASTKQDFRDMVNEMLGQLDASHMGLYGSNPEKTETMRTGRLGIEVRPLDNGVEVVHIVPNTPADREESKMMSGDIIRSVDGQTIDPEVNFWSALLEKGNEKIWLQVERDGEPVNIYIRPSSSIQNELYEEWVDERRALTEKYSDGRLGYIHIRGMNWPSFESFERELMASGYSKEGLVIDVRFNGGGWTTDMLMTVLSVQQHAYTVPRGSTDNLKNHKDFSAHYPYGQRLPLSAWTLPAAAICNHSSYSNAEIFSHAFKSLNRGPLIGEPTFGAVISTGAHTLMDGSYVRLPSRGWFVKNSGDNMEGTPAMPDYLILNPPGIKAKGEDPQLKKAVEVLLEDIGG